jgi:uncharacterized protein
VSGHHVRLKVLRVSSDGPAGMPTLLLQEEDGRRCLSLPVGLGEAQALSAGLGEVRLTRPLAHDLLVATLRIGGLSLIHAEILGPAPGSGGHQAELLLRDGAGALHRQEARPADAVAVALRMRSPVVIAEEALGASRWVDSPRVPLALADGPLQAEPRRPSCPPRPLGSLPPRRPKWRM